MPAKEFVQIVLGETKVRRFFKPVLQVLSWRRKFVTMRRRMAKLCAALLTRRRH